MKKEHKKIEKGQKYGPKSLYPCGTKLYAVEHGELIYCKYVGAWDDVNPNMINPDSESDYHIIINSLSKPERVWGEHMEEWVPDKKEARKTLIQDLRYRMVMSSLYYAQDVGGFLHVQYSRREQPAECTLCFSCDLDGLVFSVDVLDAYIYTAEELEEQGIELWDGKGDFYAGCGRTAIAHEKLWEMGFNVEHTVLYQ